ncbi:interleukin-6-like [Rhinoraja longicauda]
MRPTQNFCLLFLAMCGRVAAFPVTELVDEAERSPSPAPALGCTTCGPLALQIRSTAASLRDTQLCEFFCFCDGDQGSLLTYDFNLPQIRTQDRCTKTSFHKETCLRAIATGLQKYDPFLLSAETSIVSSNDQMRWVRSSSRSLSELLTHQLNVEFGISDVGESELEVSAPDLVSKTDWNRQVNVHVTLRDFTRFMEKSSRALRFMSL